MVTLVPHLEHLKLGLTSLVREEESETEGGGDGGLPWEWPEITISVWDSKYTTLELLKAFMRPCLQRPIDRLTAYRWTEKEVRRVYLAT
jgi:hypothetical protein